MLQAEAVFMGFILCVSGMNGEARTVCALKGSLVNLSCSAQHPTDSMKWYIRRRRGQNKRLIWKELRGDTRLSYNMSERSYTLTINDLRETDAKYYHCCKDGDILCSQTEVQLIVSDLQVKVFPSTEGQTVTMMCSTSCPLTEKPAAYIWYKNREFLYEDWSPWYQDLVSSEESVTYSCAIKGYEDLRAPEVSVDSVTKTCFTVTYARGTMCSPVDKSCSITHPKEVHVQQMSSVKLTCKTNCPMIDRQNAFTWWSQNKQLDKLESQLSVNKYYADADSYSCAVKGLEHLQSAEVCTEDKRCWSVNYVRRRICALEGSSVNITGKYSYPDYAYQLLSKSWNRMKIGSEEAEWFTESSAGVEYHNMKMKHILTIKKLKKNDSAEYTLLLGKNDGKVKKSNFPGVTLVVTGVTVRLYPAVVTEGQTVRLTCSTSCPLTDNTTYIWYFNSRPLNLSHSQNKHLVLGQVSSQDSGRYSCSVRRSNMSINSSEETLTVQSITGTSAVVVVAAAAGVCAALLVVTPLVIFLWISRKRRTSAQSPSSDEANHTEQLNPSAVYENMSSQQPEQDELHYSRVHFFKKQTDPVYSTVQPHQPREEEHAAYAVVSFRPR